MTSTTQITSHLAQHRFVPGQRRHLHSEFALLVVLAIIAMAVLIAVGVGVAFAAPTGVSERRSVESSASDHSDSAAELSTGEGIARLTDDSAFDADPGVTFSPDGVGSDSNSSLLEFLTERKAAAISSGASTTVVPTTVLPATVAAPTMVPPTTVSPTTVAPSVTAPTTQAPVATPGAPGLPPDSYWDAMARCETGGNWQMTGPRFSGGVGFANTTWKAYGGLEFAANAGAATRDQQIVVANRVATQGYGAVRAVGYSAWGCTSHVGYP